MQDETPTVELWKRVQDERDALRELIWDWYAAETALSKLHPSKRAESFEVAWVQKATANLRYVAEKDGRVPPAVAPPLTTGTALAALIDAAREGTRAVWAVTIQAAEGGGMTARLETADGLVTASGRTLAEVVAAAREALLVRATARAEWGTKVSRIFGRGANTPDPASRE